MTDDGRIIAFHSTQYWDRGGSWQGFILLSPEECERLERALRLARTGALGTKKPVVVRTRAPGIDNAVKRTSLTVKSYVPKEQP